MNPNLIRNGLVCLALLLVPAAAFATADVTPPALVSMAFAPSAADVSSTFQIISVTAEATDDNSGVQDVEVEFRSPSGANYLSFYMDQYDLVSGNPMDGVYTALQDLGTCSEAGTWTLEDIRVDDQCGNSTTYEAKASTGVLAYPPGTQTTFTVVNNNPAPPANPAPVITSFTFTPTTVDLSSATSVTGTATITGSNIQDGSFEIVSPSGTKYVYSDFSAQSQLPAGTTGTFTSTFNFSSCDGPGTWKLDYIYVDSPVYQSCSVSSGTEYTSPNWPAGTPVTTISVTNPGADTTPPALVSLMLSATSVDVSGGSASFSGTLGATDNSSGISYADATYSGTAGGTIDVSFYNNGQGIILDGTIPGSTEIGSCTIPGVYTLENLSVEDNCNNVATYTPKNLPPGLSGTSFLVLNGTIPTGTLTVNMLPEQATYNGASWYLDTGTNDYYYNGEAINGVTTGQHTVSYYVASGYTTPAPQTVTVVASQSVYATGTYASTTPSDSVQTFILPPLISGTTPGSALWNVDNGPLQPSGTIISTLAEGTLLTDGTHVVQFSGVTGYVAPPGQFVTTAGNQTTMTTGTYAVVTGSGSLTVTLAPPGAVKAGAMWNVDNGPSQISGATVSGLEAIGHVVNFLGGGVSYSPPASQDVVINADATTVTSGTYTALSTGTGSLTVTISPATIGGKWYLDGDTSLAHVGGTTVAGISGGAHTVDFTMVNGYIVPASENVTILPDETITAATGVYTHAPPFVGAADDFAGISPTGNGLLTLTLEDTGKFTGKLVTANSSTYALTGSFNSAGYFSGVAGHPPVPYVLQVTGSTPGTYVLTGSANGKDITAYPGATVEETGTYTALLSSTDTSIGIPQGTGYGTLKVSKTNVGTFTGKLADGTMFTSSGVVVAGTAGNELIVFDPNIYNLKGLLSGVLNFGVPGAGQLEGTLLWQKPPAPATHRYATGIDTTLGVAGASYNKLAPVPFTSGTLTFGGVSGISVAQPFTVSPTWVVTTGTSAVKMTITKGTGAISGFFKPGPGKPPIVFDGLLLQDPNNVSNTIGAGYFLSPVVSGTGYSGNVTLP